MNTDPLALRFSAPNEMVPGVRQSCAQHGNQAPAAQLQEAAWMLAAHTIRKISQQHGSILTSILCTVSIASIVLNVQ